MTVASNQAYVTGGKSWEILASTDYVELIPTSTRQFFMVFNNSTSPLYLKYGGEMYETWSVRIPPKFYYEAPSPIYRGPVLGKWDAANGEAHVTEFL